jgi:hypothetical protein
MFHKTETIGERARISKCPEPSLESRTNYLEVKWLLKENARVNNEMRM